MRTELHVTERTLTHKHENAELENIPFVAVLVETHAAGTAGGRGARRAVSSDLSQRGNKNHAVEEPDDVSVSAAPRGREGPRASGHVP